MRFCLAFNRTAKERQNDEKIEPTKNLAAIFGNDCGEASSARTMPATVPNFVPHLGRKTGADGSRRSINRKAFTGAENQRGSKQSHSVLIVFGRSLNQRVAGSSPARLTTISSSYSRSENSSRSDVADSVAGGVFSTISAVVSLTVP